MTLEQRIEALEALVLTLMADVEWLKRPLPSFVWGRPEFGAQPLPGAPQHPYGITCSDTFTGKEIGDATATDPHSVTATPWFPGALDYTLCSGKK